MAFFRLFPETYPISSQTLALKAIKMVLNKFDYRTLEQILVDLGRLGLYREKEWLNSGAKKVFLQLTLQKSAVLFPES